MENATDDNVKRGTKAAMNIVGAALGSGRVHICLSAKEATVKYLLEYVQTALAGRCNLIYEGASIRQIVFQNGSIISFFTPRLQQGATYVTE